MFTRILAGILTAAALFLSSGCGKQSLIKVKDSSDAKTSGQTDKDKAASQTKASAQSTTAQTTEKAGSTQKAGTVESLMNYGTGSTQLKAKQRMTDKIKNINATHNKKTEEELKKN